MDSVKITFQPENRTVTISSGMLIRNAAILSNIFLDTPCGGEGVCGKCKIKILSGIKPPTSREKQLLSDNELNSGVRLACYTKIEQDMIIEIVSRQNIKSRKVFISDRKRQVIPDPVIKKKYLELSPPTVKYPVSDEENIAQNIKKLQGIDWKCLQTLTDKLRNNNFKFTAILNNEKLLDVEAGNTVNKNYGVAIDLGTTTVVGILVDLMSGKEIAVTAETNPQSVYGDDIVSRINFGLTNPEGFGQLQKNVIDIVNKIIAELAESAGVDTKNIYEIVVVGNTAMEHLFLGIPPKNLVFAPYVPVLKNEINLRAEDLGLKIHPRANVYVFPIIAGFVGGDTIAMILALNLDKSKDIKLAIDIGTNGEIVIGSKERLIAVSTAAGPAFEGAHIQHGMKAVAGAIDAVEFTEADVFCRVIDDIQPEGICGSGLIDAVAGLIKLGIIDQNGRLLTKKEINGNVSPALRNRITESGQGNRFCLYSDEKKKIEITQQDIRELQLAKGAIHTGIKILLKEMKLKEKDITEIYLAGTFGNYIDKMNALTIGLLPDVPLEKVKFVGNAAIEGARMVLVSQKMRTKLAKISRQIEYIELSSKPEFMNEFSQSMFF